MLERIRNFSIIAHIDHGKSTLADRLLEHCGAIPGSLRLKKGEQVLDQMELERERGITIKAKAVSLPYRSRDGSLYSLNLIDTPGHMDFTYEVSRALAACEGALLVIDASQGVEAQTLASVRLALENDLTLIPIINKIDLPTAEPAKVRRQIEDILCLDASGAILASAKEGLGTEEILDAIVNRIPAPKGSIDASLKALVFDSTFDPYQGVIVYVRLYDGRVMAGTRILLMASGSTFEVSEVGVFTPEKRKVPSLQAGDVGYVTAGIKELSQIRVGDTITGEDRPTPIPLPGFKEVRPMVFAGIYPLTGDYLELKEALEKLCLNDSSLTFEPETSVALGFGFRCGFLGLLHMEIVQERLEREFGLRLLITAPTVVYRVTMSDGRVIEVENPGRFPPRGQFAKIEEPYIMASIMSPLEYIGPTLQLCQEKRGTQQGMDYLDDGRVLITYRLPLNEVVLDFYDRLKSITKGYASMDYEFVGYGESELVKLDVLVNGEPVDALSIIVHKDKAYQKGRQLVERMRDMVPRQLFDVVIQASIEGRIIARERIPALRKNVTGKCYGGDVTRKRKLLEKQREGKRRMKQVGRVEIPQEAFLAVLRVHG